MINRPYYFDMNGVMKNENQQYVLFKSKVQGINGDVIPIRFKQQINLDGQPKEKKPIVTKREIVPIKEQRINKTISMEEKEINDRIIKLKENREFLAKTVPKKINKNITNTGKMNVSSIRGMKR